LRRCKKVQGLGFSTNVETDKGIKIRSSINTAISKGKFKRQLIQGVEGNQGPYKLSGANNELFVIILSGSENVYVDGIIQTRGSNNDYTIDYNASEVTFTPKRPITKDSRIIVEFEYSEMSYAKFALSSENIIQTKNTTFYLNLFSENDAKNQNLRQALTDDNKLMFNEIGDNIDLALVNNIQLIDTFNRDAILYYKTDTIVNSIHYTDIYLYSTDSLKANYRLGFSYVGENEGNYIRLQSGANGRIFEWVAPQNGILQGDHEPVKLLVSPKKKQMISFGGETIIKERNRIHFEAALTNNDLNLFSQKGDGDNVGYAFKIGAERNILKNDTGITFFKIGADYMFTDKYFDAFEPYKDPEFSRDWNLTDNEFLFNENFLNLNMNYYKKGFGRIDFFSELLGRADIYEGNRNNLSVNIKKEKFLLDLNFNRLSTNDSVYKTEFIRYSARVEKKISIVNLGISDVGEKNIFKDIINSELLPISFRFNQWEAYVRTSVKKKSSITLSYINREDFLPKNEGLKFVSNSHDFKIAGVIYNTKKHKLKSNLIYRKLNIIDTTYNDNKSENTLTGRIEHSNIIKNGMFSSTGLIEHVSGNELVKEFAYLEVQSGQGYFTWIDFNENNIKELNEFVKANFRDEANFIRISIPSNTYEKVYMQMFRQSFNFTPRRAWNNKSGIKKLLSNVSDRFSYSLNRKIANTIDYYKINISDSLLISMSSLIRNNVGFDFRKTGTKINYSVISNKNKLLLINGIDTRVNTFHNIMLNQRLGNFIIADSYKTGHKSLESEFFSDNNFLINYDINKTSLTYKVDKKSDLKLSFTLKKKKNQSGEENMFAYDIGGEYLHSMADQGNIIMNFNFINIDYVGSSNSSVSYEILEGLQAGKNYVWAVLWYKKITNYLQLELNYAGRKSGENKVIHTGSMSIRAIF